MYFNKIAITLLVIFSICASFVIGLFVKDHKETENLKKQYEAALKEEQANNNSSTTGVKNGLLQTTNNQESEYSKILEARKEEAARIQLKLQRSTTTQ